MLRSVPGRALLVGALLLLALPAPAPAGSVVVGGAIGSTIVGGPIGPGLAGGAITPVNGQIGVGFGFGFGHPLFFPGPGFVAGACCAPGFVSPGFVVVPGTVLVGRPLAGKGHIQPGSTIIIPPGFGGTVIVLPPAKLIGPK